MNELYRIAERKTDKEIGVYMPPTAREEYNFCSVESARKSNCNGIYEDKTKYKVHKYRLVLIDNDCDATACNHTSRMKRITDRLPDGTAYVKSEAEGGETGAFTTQRRVPEMIGKLAAYEDTGWEPEEINPQIGWIPTSKQLPKNEYFKYRCWATIKHIEGERPFVVKLRWAYGYWQWENGKRLSDKFVVLAWIREKIPEPYQPLTEQ